MVLRAAAGLCGAWRSVGSHCNASPAEAMAESFGHQGSGGCVMSALPLMYLLQKLSSFFQLDALLEDS
jgi:hypothetical protein